MKVCPLSQGRAVTEREVLALVPDWSLLMQVRTPNSHSLVQKVLGWSEWSCCDWWVKILIGDTALQIWLDRECLSPINWNMIQGTPLKGSAQKAGTQGRQTVQCSRHSVQLSRQLNAGFSLRCSLHGRPLLAMAARLCFQIWAQLTTRNPS